MLNIDIHNCKDCGIELFNFQDGENVQLYEDFAGTTPHTKLRCEINEIVSKRLQQTQIEINMIKERLNLE